ncbi:MAG: phosphatase PAP2 family protein [FCB group bacterium]|nr:phosphatase PAP2 family protein [FCB group bacterium]
MSIELIQWFQHLPVPGFISLMKGITFLGNESFYLLGLPVIFWCWKKELGLPLLLLLYVTFLVNTLLKLGFALPRPPETFWQVSAGGYGFPSGHSQMAMVLWGYLGWKTGRKTAAGMIIFLIGLSRIVLGVHYPADVLGGWTIGGLTLGAAIYLETRWQETSLTMPAVPTAFVFFWVGVVVPMLISDPTVLRVSGFFAGLGAGLLLEQQTLCLSTKAKPVYQVLKILIGIGGAVAIQTVLKKLFPAPDVFIWMRYGLTGLWIGWGAPWCFQRLGSNNQSGNR